MIIEPPRRSALLAVSVALACCIVLLSPETTPNIVQASPAPELVFEWTADEDCFFIGEELQYNVSYSIFDIGLVKMQVIDTASRNGMKVYKGKAFLDSYSGIPFVDLHQVFYSEMNTEAFSQFFTTHTTTKPEQMPYTKYVFEYHRSRLLYESGTDPGGIVKHRGEEPVFEPQLDGLSLFYYARLNFRQVKKYSVPVLVNEKSYKTHFNFMNKRSQVEIDAVDYPVDIIEFDGTSDFTGVFGLTGYFKGLFSNDQAGIPIVAKMKVILGSVHIELVKWTRPGWTPPRASLQ